MRREKNGFSFIGGVFLPCVVAAVLLCFASALENLENGVDAEGLRQMEEALRRGCAACYAVEGAYPPDLEYLEAHYGIRVDEEKYTVHYSMFAENLMPDITVLEKMP